MNAPVQLPTASIQLRYTHRPWSINRPQKKTPIKYNSTRYRPITRMNLQMGKCGWKKKLWKNLHVRHEIAHCPAPSRCIQRKLQYVEMFLHYRSLYITLNDSAIPICRGIVRYFILMKITAAFFNQRINTHNYRR